MWVRVRLLAALVLLFWVSCTSDETAPGGDNGDDDAGAAGDSNPVGGSGGSAGGPAGGGSGGSNPNGGDAGSAGSEAGSGGDGNGGSAGGGVGGDGGEPDPSATGHVIYAAHIGAGPTELYAVPLRDGVPGDADVINGPLGEKSVGQVSMMPGRHSVLYMTWTPPQAVFHELFLVDLSSDVPGSAVRLSNPLPAEGSIYRAVPSPDENSIVYVAYPNLTTGADAYFVDLSGPTPSVPRPVHRRNSATEDVYADCVRWRGSYVEYCVDASIGAYRREIHLVNTASSSAEPLLLSRDGVAGDAMPLESIYEQARDRLLYRRRPTAGGPDQVYLVTGLPEAPSMPRRLDGRLVQPMGYIGLGQWSPDGEKFTYYSNAVNPNGDLYLLDLTLTNPDGGVRLNTSLPTDGFLFGGTWSPDSRRYVYLASQQTAEVPELFVVRLDGSAPSAPAPASGTFTPGGSLDTTLGTLYGWSPDSTLIGFIADANQDDMVELFVTPVTSSGAGTRRRVNTALASLDSDVNAFRFAPNGGAILYVADQDEAGIKDFYTAPIVGGAPGSPRRLNRATGAERGGHWFMPAFIAGGTLVAFAEWESDTGPYRLSLAPTDGSTPAEPFGEPDHEVTSLDWLGD